MIKTSEVIELKVCTLRALNLQHENCDEFPYWIWKQYWFKWFQNSPWSIRMKHTYVYLLGGERDFSLFGLCLMQILYVYEPAYETGGQFWPHVHIRIIASLVLLQVCFIGVFSVKGLGRGSFIAIPLPILTLLFNEHCRHRFFPAFRHFNMEVSHLNLMKNLLVFKGSNDLTDYIWECISWAYLDGYEASSSSKWMVCLYMKLPLSYSKIVVDENQFVSFLKECSKHSVFTNGYT